jgi:hypothetical protein
VISETKKCRLTDGKKEPRGKKELEQAPDGSDFIVIEGEGTFELTCVAGNVTAVCEVGLSFQKAEDGVPLSIPDPATWSGFINDDAKCSILTHGSVQIRSDNLSFLFIETRLR